MFPSSSQVQDDDLARMIEEADVSGRLWKITCQNRLGSWSCIMKMTVLEGASELSYASQDVFCKASFL